MTTSSPELLLPVAPPAKPHPVDVALAALSELAAQLLVSTKPTRFAELQGITNVAMQVQRLRTPTNVDEAEGYDGPNMAWGNVGVVGGPIHPHPRPVRFNDGADLNRELIMVAQNFLEKYVEAEKLKNKPSDSRLREVTELSDLMDLRARLKDGGEEIPAAINTRIEQLLKRIGESHEPAHESERDPLVHPEPVRGHQADGAGEPDGDRVGEPVAFGAGGDDGAG